MANIAANKHGGEFDDELLKSVLEEIPTDTINVDLMGFSEEELSDIMQEVPTILEYEEKEIRPYHMTHVLLSFPPEKMILIKEHLEKIIEIEGVEYEQGSNG